MLFEVSDTVIKTNENEIGAKNLRKLCAAYSNSNTSGFEVIFLKRFFIIFFKHIHGLLDYVMNKLNI